MSGVTIAAMRLAWIVVGALTVIVTIRSAVRTFVMPRSVPDPVSRQVFRSLRWLYDLRAQRASSYAKRDAIMASYAPYALLGLTFTWVALILFGYMLIYRGLGTPSWNAAFELSGSSLLTLGFASVEGVRIHLLVFTEATLGLAVVALLIAYLPTIYGTFSRRELAVSLLELRAGAPPTGVELLVRYHRLDEMPSLRDLWRGWENWFVELEESHTSLAAVNFFRSPDPERSWVTAGGAVLDAAALRLSVLDLPHDSNAEVCLLSGVRALRALVEFFRLELPEAVEMVSITRDEFDKAFEKMRREGLPMVRDRDAAWEGFSAHRGAYDHPLLALAALTMAPYAPWSSDRSMRLKFRRGLAR